MNEMVNIFLMGKKYEVPSNLTIMGAMEYAGYQLKRGCGCRNGFCGACATIYRTKNDNELKVCLACQTKVENDMYIATLPFFPLKKAVYDIETVKPTEQIMMQLYPEIYACIGCNACTNSCTQSLNVMQYIAYAQRGEYEKCAEESFAHHAALQVFLILRLHFLQEDLTVNTLLLTVSILKTELKKLKTEPLRSFCRILCRSRLKR